MEREKPATPHRRSWCHGCWWW